ncbi:MAG: hypothetical protein ACT443_05365, partial [Gemmatimonadota bacterium]
MTPKKTVLALAALVVIALPTTAFGQIGVGARAGTLGLGGEISIGLGSRLAIRGGMGTLPQDLNGDFSDIEYTINPPSTIWNVGVDFYPGLGSFRISAGLLNRRRYDIEANTVGTTTIGDQQYSGDIHLAGFLENEKETAPYVGIGFGRTASRGIGLFIDLGVAQMGTANIQFTTATCTITSGPGAGQPCPNQGGKTFSQNANEE